MSVHAKENGIEREIESQETEPYDDKDNHR